MILAYPWVLFLYIPLVFCVFWVWRRPKPAVPFTTQYEGPQTLIHQLLQLPLILKALGLAFCIFALARPQLGTSYDINESEGLDIVICLDISDSMLIEDMQPNNRLESAKDTIRRFVKNRKNDRIGIVIFAGEAFTLVPPTLDHDLVLKRIETIQTAQQANIKEGTALGVALAAGAQRLKETKSNSKVMVFLTDGENNSGTIDPETGLNVAQSYNIRIYSVGIGRDGPTKLPIIQRDVMGNIYKTYQPFESTVNEALLSKMASTTGGKYYRASREDSLPETFKDIDSLERSRVEAQRFSLYEELFQSYALAGFVLLMAGIVLQKFVLRVFP